jgi:hypothetical protein
VNISVAIQDSAILQFVRVRFFSESACKCDRFSIFEAWCLKNSDDACKREICDVDVCRSEIFEFCEVEIFEFQISRVFIDQLFRHIDLFADEF